MARGQPSGGTAVYGTVVAKELIAFILANPSSLTDDFLVRVGGEIGLEPNGAIWPDDVAVTPIGRFFAICAETLTDADLLRVPSDIAERVWEARR